MKNYKEISERYIGKIVNKKALPGEQTQELVQTIKSEPRFTIEESYGQILANKKASIKTPKDSVEDLIINLERVARVLDKLQSGTISKEKKLKISSMFSFLKKKFDDLIK